MNPERNMKFMQLAMKYLPEAKELFNQYEVEMDMEKLQPVLELLLKVMDDAYELGQAEAKQ